MTSTSKTTNKIFVFLFLVFLLQSCSYSFTGAVIAPDIKTVRVENFGNSASIVIPSLAQEFTEKLRDILVSRSNLRMVDKGTADVEFSGEIIDYKITPVNIGSNDRPAQNRLTISVRVKYENKKYPEQSWEKTFANFEDFDANTDISTIQQQLIEEINNKLTLGIFNQAFGSW